MREGRKYNNIDCMDHIVSIHLLSNISITKYFSYTPRFDGVFWRDNLFAITYGAYVINLIYKQSKGTRLVALFFDRNTTVYFDSFGTMNIFLNKY